MLTGSRGYAVGCGGAAGPARHASADLGVAVRDGSCRLA
jgi:hypothetical protein